MERNTARKYQSSGSNIYYLSRAEAKANANAGRKTKGTADKRHQHRIGEKLRDTVREKTGNIAYDITLITVIFVLVLFGLIMVFSASSPSALAYQGNAYHYIIRQGAFAVVGIIVMFIVARVDYHIYGKYALHILVGSLLALFTVYIPGLGRVVNNARRWVGVGIFSVQPSELAKIGVIIYFAYSLSLAKNKIKDFWAGIVRYLVILGFFAGVLMLEPHFSCTIVLCLSCVLIMIVAGAKLWHFGILGIFAAIAAFIAAWSAPYRRDRLLTFLDPFADTSDTGYQIANSLYAIGSGGIFGLGLGMSRQKLLYLPEAHNDFIFAIVCEELGLLGAMAVITLFIMLIWRGFRIAQTAKDTFGALLATGITSLIGIQATLNIAVVTSSVPVTGVALPFFSYGGTSLVILLASMGILLNISKQCKHPVKGE